MGSGEDDAGTAPLPGRRDEVDRQPREPAGADGGPLRTVTSDLDLANERFRQVYAAADISMSRDDPAFEYGQEIEGDAELSTGRFWFRGHGGVNVQLRDAVSVVRVRAGGHDWDVEGFRGTGLVLVQPEQTFRSVLQAVTADTVNFSPSVLRRAALDVYGEEATRVVFGHARPVGRAGEQYWNATHDFVRRALSDPAVDQAPLLRADLHRRIAVATLECFPRGAGAERPRRYSTAERAAVYRRAVAFMRDARGLPITLEDVARHAGLSTLELSRAFRAHRGTTPGTVLRQLRLEAAHEDLVRAEPAAGVTVRDVALHWAFPDPGEFARRYRAAYGVDPAATLRSPARARRA